MIRFPKYPKRVSTGSVAIRRCDVLRQIALDAVSSGNITDELIQQYIREQEGGRIKHFGPNIS